MKTQKEAVAWIYKAIGKQFDYDKFYGYQCMDIVNAYWNYISGGSLNGASAKDIPFANDFSGKATVYKNTPSFLPKAGDIVVWGSSINGYHGHTAIVTSANLEIFVVVEQNWLNGGWTQGEAKGGTGWEKATQRSHQYSSDMWFIRPKFKTSVVTKAKQTVKKAINKVTPKSKGKKILLVAGHGKGYMSNDSGAVGNGTNERDFIRKYIVPNVAKYLKSVGHTVEYYGGVTMNQDLFQDTAYGQYVGNYKDYGMYWVARQKYDIVVEFHLDAATKATGGHVIIAKGLEADSIDIGIQQALRKTIGLIREIDRRDNLLNVNVAKQQNVNYRLVELGFITSKKDMTYINKNLQTFTKLIAEGIHGSKIETSIVINNKPKVKKSNSKTYKVKKNDTLWKIAKANNTTVEKLKLLNKLKNDILKVDQVIKLK
ncbi:N-acetylmuramoyl-L-alanine amidase [Macrococcoides caseolyticum]|uniref:N-acetylmuramoyl-L-alanine amidase n=1 Tax=Macrococcoides caseolyticum TaxID=69966 RepID=UPI001F254C7B|nr:N-acetylmuramoyl-L-alanine amidase [Macrococcus caseolyticus]MCE4957245.1 N-acetylmuramoyl-L-alanine amidase [Macrococcus caseolyticus]